MNKIYTIAFFITLLVTISKAQDYIYIHQNNGTVTKIAINKIDSIIFYDATPANDTIIDSDGNVYDTVTISTQIWMKQNLRTTKYNDGTDIPLITDWTEWDTLTTPGYCWYDNDELNKDIYGALYNWYVVSTGKLCPESWHVATDEDWTALINYLGGESVAGGKLKESGTEHWLSPNTEATNESGFTAIGAGGRDTGGKFEYLKNLGYWWTSDEATATMSWFRAIDSNYGGVYRDSGSKRVAYSIRCVKD